MEQRIITINDGYEQLDQILGDFQNRCLFMVRDSAYRFLGIKNYFDQIESRLGIKLVSFSNFQPNPMYESVAEGVELFRQSGSKTILAIGGGSAMDVAKCIKLYSNMNPEVNYLQQPIVENDVRLIAMPTTAGTGSEATRYAVIYYEGAKQSVTHASCIPSIVLMDRSAIKTLPLYQKKSTMLDALCHAMESFWSVNSTEESKGYSRQAIRSILKNMDGYLANDDAENAAMLLAANTAGKAINITQTTAGHAMCYKLTSLYGIAHGHAAALCDRVLFPWMIEHIDLCIDSRGKAYLQDTLCELAESMGCSTPAQAAELFAAIVSKLEMPTPAISRDDLASLSISVNPVRLKNHPVTLDHDAIVHLYQMIQNGGSNQ